MALVGSADKVSGYGDMSKTVGVIVITAVAVLVLLNRGFSGVTASVKL